MILQQQYQQFDQFVEVLCGLVNIFVMFRRVTACIRNFPIQKVLLYLNKQIKLAL